MGGRQKLTKEKREIGRKRSSTKARILRGDKPGKESRERQKDPALAGTGERSLFDLL